MPKTIQRSYWVDRAKDKLREGLSLDQVVASLKSSGLTMRVAQEVAMDALRRLNRALERL